MSEGLHFVGVRMDAERAKALRILAARHNVSIAEMVRRATEAQYGDEMDLEVARFSAPSVVHARTTRTAKGPKARQS
jgi:hypothetical protein